MKYEAPTVRKLVSIDASAFAEHVLGCLECREYVKTRDGTSEDTSGLCPRGRGLLAVIDRQLQATPS
jgi:hypothetical protein